MPAVERDRQWQEQLEDAFRRLPDVLTQTLLRWGISEVRGVVEAHITVVDEQAEREVAEAFESGVVELSGALRPIS